MQRTILVNVKANNLDEVAKKITELKSSVSALNKVLKQGFKSKDLAFNVKITADTSEFISELNKVKRDLNSEKPVKIPVEVDSSKVKSSVAKATKSVGDKAKTVSTSKEVVEHVIKQEGSAKGDRAFNPAKYNISLKRMFAGLSDSADDLAQEIFNKIVISAKKVDEAYGLPRSSVLLKDNYLISKLNLFQDEFGFAKGIKSNGGRASYSRDNILDYTNDILSLNENEIKQVAKSLGASMEDMENVIEMVKRLREHLISLKDVSFSDWVGELKSLTDVLDSASAKLTNFVKKATELGALKPLQGFGSAFKSLTGLTGGIAKASGNLVTNALVSGGRNLASSTFMLAERGLHSIAQETIELGDAMVQYRNNMTAMDYTTKQVNESMKDLGDYGKKTVYDAGDLLDVSAKFASNGYDIKEANSIAKAVAGLVSNKADSKLSYTRVSNQLGDLLSKGTVLEADYKIMRQAMNSLGSKMVRDKMDELAQAKGYERAADAVKKGQISAKEFSDILQEVGNSSTFQDMVDNIATPRQALSNLNETLANLFSYSDFDENFEEIPGALNKLYTSTANGIKNITDIVGSATFKKGVTSFGNDLSTVIDKTIAEGKRINKDFGIPFVASIATFNSDFKKGLKGFNVSDELDNIARESTRFNTYFGENIGKNTSKFLKSLAEMGSSISTGINQFMGADGLTGLNRIVDMYNNLGKLAVDTNAMGAVADVINEVYGVINEVLTKPLNISSAKGVVDSFRVFTRALGDILKDLNANTTIPSDLLDSVTSVIDFITNVVGKIKSATTNQDFSNISNNIKNFIDSVVKGLEDIYANLGTSIIKVAGSEAMASFLSSVKQFIVSVNRGIETLLKSIPFSGGTVEGGLTRILGFLEFLVRFMSSVVNVLSHMPMQLLAGVAIAGLASKIVGVLSTIGSVIEAYNNLKPLLGSGGLGLGGLTKGASGLANVADDVVRLSPQAMLGKSVGNLANSTKSWVKPLGASIGKVVSQSFRKLVPMYPEASIGKEISSLNRAISMYPETFMGNVAGASSVKGLPKILQTFSSKVPTALKTSASKVLNSVSSLKGGLLAMGVDMGATIIDGMVQSSNLSKTMKLGASIGTGILNVGASALSWGATGMAIGGPVGGAVGTALGLGLGLWGQWTKHNNNTQENDIASQYRAELNRQQELQSELQNQNIIQQLRQLGKNNTQLAREVLGRDIESKEIDKPEYQAKLNKQAGEFRALLNDHSEGLGNTIQEASVDKIMDMSTEIDQAINKAYANKDSKISGLRQAVSKYFPELDDNMARMTMEELENYVKFLQESSIMSTGSEEEKQSLIAEKLKSTWSGTQEQLNTMLSNLLGKTTDEWQKALDSTQIANLMEESDTEIQELVNADQKVIELGEKMNQLNTAVNEKLGKLSEKTRNKIDEAVVKIRSFDEYLQEAGEAELNGILTDLGIKDAELRSAIIDKINKHGMSFDEAVRAVQQETGVERKEAYENLGEKARELGKAVQELIKKNKISLDNAVEFLRAMGIDSGSLDDSNPDLNTKLDESYEKNPRKGKVDVKKAVQQVRDKLDKDLQGMLDDYTEAIGEGEESSEGEKSSDKSSKEDSKVVKEKVDKTKKKAQEVATKALDDSAKQIDEALNGKSMEDTSLGDDSVAKGTLPNDKASKNELSKTIKNIQGNIRKLVEKGVESQLTQMDTLMNGSEDSKGEGLPEGADKKGLQSSLKTIQGKVRGLIEKQVASLTDNLNTLASEQSEDSGKDVGNDKALKSTLNNIQGKIGNLVQSQVGTLINNLNTLATEQGEEGGDKAGMEALKSTLANIQGKLSTFVQTQVGTLVNNLNNLASEQGEGGDEANTEALQTVLNDIQSKVRNLIQQQITSMVNQLTTLMSGGGEGQEAGAGQSEEGTELLSQAVTQLNEAVNQLIQSLVTKLNNAKTVVDEGKAIADAIDTAVLGTAVKDAVKALENTIKAMVNKANEAKNQATVDVSHISADGIGSALQQAASNLASSISSLVAKAQEAADSASSLVGGLLPSGGGGGKGGKKDSAHSWTGGLVTAPVYRATGGIIDWKKRATDTVPTMLTKGEFVLRKQAVKDIGVGLLMRMNKSGMKALKNYSNSSTIYNVYNNNNARINQNIDNKSQYLNGMNGLDKLMRYV